GIVAVHDEELIYLRELAELRAQGLRRHEFDWVGFLVAFKAVLLEGTEVAFIVIAFGAAGGVALTSAVVGAIVAGILVIGLGVAGTWLIAAAGGDHSQVIGGCALVALVVVLVVANLCRAGLVARARVSSARR